MNESTNGHEPLDAEEEVSQEQEEPKNRIDYVPQYRLSYSRWAACILGAFLLLVALFTGAVLALGPLGYLLLAALAVGAAVLWHFDSKKKLLSRVPPPGWKSVIKPDKLVHMEPEDFDELMRFELKGDEDDELENHRVRWASRYSRDVIFLSWCLVALAVGCIVCAVLFPYVTISWNEMELPHTYYLVPWLVLAAPVVLVRVVVNRFDWHYRVLMLDDTHLYLLKENPAWLPWSRGQNDPIPLSSIWSADPVDTYWGERWGHGTVVLTYQLGYGNMRTKVLERVPNHRAFCDAINSMRGGGMPFVGMGTMY
jgi:hypothetical protein